LSKKFKDFWKRRAQFGYTDLKAKLCLTHYSL